MQLAKLVGLINKTDAIPRVVGSKRLRLTKEPTEDQELVKEEEKEEASVGGSNLEKTPNTIAATNAEKDKVETVEIGDGKLGFVEPCILDAIKEKMQEINP
jgi:hypothetical protein